MAEKKKKSRFKKILKSLAKGAGVIGGGMLAAKAFGGRRRGPVSTVGQPFGGSRTAYKPPHLGEGVHQKWGTGVPDRVKMLPTDTMGGPPDKKWYNPTTWWKEGGRVNAKKGGRIGVGIAKRGYGRALGRGKK